MKISEVMKPAPTVTPRTSVLEAAQAMRDSDVEIVPVGTDGEIEGIVTPREIALAAVAEPCKVERTPVDEIASRVIAFCHESQEINAVLQSMEAHGQTDLLVRNSDGLVVGVVSITDILTAKNGNGDGPPVFAV